jgi:ribosomal protein L11 methylase PrmA
MPPRKTTLDLINYITKNKRRKIKFLEYSFIINPNVFPIDSDFSYTSKIIAKRIRPKKTDFVLDVGTGTGVFAVIAAIRGAKKVVAVDIDNNSLKNANENVNLNKLEKVIEIRKSNLFSNIKNSEKFDIITANLPLADVNHKTKVKHFLFDYKYKTHEKFLSQAKKHLTKNGIILIPSGEIANEKRLLELIIKYNYKILKVEKKKFQRLIWKLYILKIN